MLLAGSGLKDAYGFAEDLYLCLCWGAEWAPALHLAVYSMFDSTRTLTMPTLLLQQSDHADNAVATIFGET